MPSTTPLVRRAAPARGAGCPVRARACRRGGFTLVEVMVSSLVLVIGALGLLASVTAADRMVESSRQTRTAFDAARAVCEDMRSRSLSEVFAAYNATTVDDPSGATAPGVDFDVRGLSATLDDADGRVGEVHFPSADGLTLREDVVDRNLGMPRDLDGDGAVETGAMLAAPLVLPVTIRVRWRGPRGPQVVELHRVLFAMGGT